MSEDDSKFGNRGNTPISSKYKINKLPPNTKAKVYVEKKKKVNNTKYFLYDFKKHGCGLFTQSELEKRFSQKWKNIETHYLNKNKRIRGLYYIRTEKF